MEDFQVKIWRDEFSNRVNLGFRVRQGKDWAFAKPMEFVFETRKDGEDIKPTLTIDGFEAEQFLKAMAEALDEKDIKTDKDAKIEGTLNATKYHLEDMRTLLKLTPKTQ